MADPLPKVDFGLLTVFDALARLRSATLVARELGVTQGAISHDIKKLRQIFQDPLFIYSTKGFELTPRCARITPAIRSMLIDGRALFHDTEYFDPEITDRLFCIALNDLGVTAVLPGIVSLIAERGPKIRIETVPTESISVVDRLAEGTVDLVIGRLPPEANLRSHHGHDIIQQALYSQEHVVVSNADLNLPGCISLEEFAARRQIAYSSPRSAQRELEATMDSRGLRRNVVVSTPYITAIPSVVAETPGMVALIPVALAKLSASNPRLRFSHLTDLNIVVVIKMFWHRRFDNDLACRWLRDIAREAIANSDMGRSDRSRD